MRGDGQTTTQGRCRGLRCGLSAENDPPKGSTSISLLEQRKQQRASTAPKPGTNTYSRGDPDLSRYAAPAHGKESPEEKASRRAERREANLQAQMSPEKVRNLYFYYAN